jgi:hypothetical protein
MSDKPATPRKVLKLKAGGDPAPIDVPPVPETPENAIDTAMGAAPPEMEAPAAPVTDAQPEPKPTWTDADEATLRELTARRKAAGYQNRGRDVGDQRVKVSDIRPNASTIAGTIIGLVEAKGTISRAELLKLMAETPFPQPKAKPQDQGWCQGYVAGAIRNGFLTVVDEAPEGSGEAF